MNEQASRYPLSWPNGWKRTPYGSRRRAMFGKRRATEPGGYAYKQNLDVSDGLNRLNGELRRLRAGQVVISSNLRLNLDGSINRGQGKMLDDPGVAVYFQLQGKPHALACDKWSSTADNMAAIAGHIEAIRPCDRYGVGSIEQAFAGYAALPPTEQDWSIVLGVSATATRDEINAAHRQLAAQHHPDKGGRPEDMARINAARDIALKAVRR